jgi:hypothetical protein
MSITLLAPGYINPSADATRLFRTNIATTNAKQIVATNAVITTHFPETRLLTFACGVVSLPLKRFVAAVSGSCRIEVGSSLAGVVTDAPHCLQKLVCEITSAPHFEHVVLPVFITFTGGNTARNLLSRQALLCYTGTHKQGREFG